VRRFVGRFTVSRPPCPRGYDVDGTASEVDPRTLP
jgi:hypothetical protein